MNNTQKQLERLLMYSLITDLIIQSPKNAKDKRTNNNNQQNGTDEVIPTLSFTQLEGKCYCCGKPGHKSPQCRLKEKIAREKWAINQIEQQHLQTSTNTDERSVRSNVSSESATRNATNPTVGWSGVHCYFAQTNNLKDLILLDSDSTDTVFCNEKYVTDIRKVDKELNIYTNGGNMVSNKNAQSKT